MHEASLCQGLLDLVLSTVAKHNEECPNEPPIRKVTEIICSLGLYSCIEPVTLASCFELFAENTPAAGATVTINKAPLECRCEACGTTFTACDRPVICPACGGDNIQFDGGHGLMLISLRVDTEE